MPMPGVETAGCSAAVLSVHHWMSKTHEATFGKGDECMHEAKACQARETAGSDLQYYGYTGFDSSSTKRIDNSIPLTEATVGHILKDPVISSDSTVSEFMRDNLKEALALPIGAELKREYIDFIDARDRVRPRKSSDENKMQTRAYVLMVAVHVHSKQSAPSSKSFDGRDQVRDAIRQLGSAYSAVADQFHDLGIDGDFISKNEIGETEMTEEFGLSSAMKRRVLANLLVKYKPEQTKYCSMGYLCVHMTFDFYPVPKYPPPSSEYVRCRLNKLMAYESARQLLGIADIEAAQTNTNGQHETQSVPAPSSSQNGAASSAEDSSSWQQVHAR